MKGAKSKSATIKYEKAKKNLKKIEKKVSRFKVRDKIAHNITTGRWQTDEHSFLVQE